MKSRHIIAGMVATLFCATSQAAAPSCQQSSLDNLDALSVTPRGITAQINGKSVSICRGRSQKQIEAILTSRFQLEASGCLDKSAPLYVEVCGSTQSACIASLSNKPKPKAMGTTLNEVDPDMEKNAQSAESPAKPVPGDVDGDGIPDVR